VRPCPRARQARPLAPRLRGRSVGTTKFSAIVLYEWRRGPRRPEELRAQQGLFPDNQVALFGAPEAELAAALYTNVRRARGREIDLAIAAGAIINDAALWTPNPGDFEDVPGWRLVRG